ncbi:hypothetical protein [Marinoscillum furvescens]|uniref:PH (Pleckstrin Homology) domain-containing protein n=1 Tax=Marinoscillum furvescens DSM 4134 TaxID=1122208 RepID=A0A3D9L5Z9_MARFU|nr:hypothetical protein [Marinoscillum furvescens]REE01600.1 hypothetical protein C7460_103116 [Marinoscillum furvescens DSM 4134]
MIVSKPKTNTLTALTIFLILIFGSFFVLLDSLLSSESYFIVKLILAPVVLVIGLVVLGKLLGAIKIVKLGDNKLQIFYPISRLKVEVKVPDILGYREEVIATKNGEFREVKILYTKKKILKLSNRENTEYDAVVRYLKKKVKVKKV